ncbi:hypothetical protein B0H17DRAFT_1194083 [Mycena rosella]|uniref:Uncharacterized protein n=1 Tax=Mycena rosella TaxID=1033263 RepID=A0AAD7DZS5_MYCRO|nr:hypothetical protein B0H17DRAFT_1194083 [Mycena rosella]
MALTPPDTRSRAACDRFQRIDTLIHDIRDSALRSPHVRIPYTHADPAPHIITSPSTPPGSICAEIADDPPPPSTVLQSRPLVPVRPLPCRSSTEMLLPSHGPAHLRCIRHVDLYTAVSTPSSFDEIYKLNVGSGHSSHDIRASIRAHLCIRVRAQRPTPPPRAPHSESTLRTRPPPSHASSSRL